MLVRRHFVVNKRSLCAYTSNEGFETNPIEPLAVVPFEEIDKVTWRKVDTLQVLRDSSRGPHLGSQDELFILVVAFRQSYKQLMRQVWNYEYVDV